MPKPRPLKFMQAMQLMRSHDPLTMEPGFAELASRPRKHLDDLLVAFRHESDAGLRCWLLELIGMARSERAFPVLKAALEGPDESLLSWAVYGLRELDTKEARRLLWEAKSWERGSAEERARFRSVLNAGDAESSKRQ